jgi:hypothetical protein
MAFVNLPPNLQDLFYGITDRIAKLETGPNQAMYTAEAAEISAQGSTAIALSAQSVATQAQVQAINASIQANIAQSQATIASSQATNAQLSANGKNTIYYGTTATPNTATITNAAGNGAAITYTAFNGFTLGQTVAISGIVPSQYNIIGVITSASFTQFTVAGIATGSYIAGGSAIITGLNYKVGDIYYQYNTSSQIIAQFSWDGTAWQSTPITNSVITNLDAGKITSGIITSIEYNNGSGTFRVTPQGALTASSATITGTINATAGYFGNTITGNYWSIGSSGITAVGSGTITGGLIQGSSITVPNSSAWKFAVDSAGSLQAVNANITGQITSTSGSIGGWTISASSLSRTSGTKTMTMDSANAILTISDSSSGVLTGGGINITSSGVTGSYGARGLTFGGTVAFSNDGLGNAYIQSGANNSIRLSSNGGVLSTTYPVFVETNLDVTGRVQIAGNLNAPNIPSTTSAANVRWTTGGVGQFQFVSSSSQRFKDNITDITNIPELDPTALLSLPVRAFTYKPEYLDANDDRFNVMIPGFIAEELDEVYPIATDYDENGPVSWNDRLLIPALVKLVQDLNKRIKLLEGN